MKEIETLILEINKEITRIDKGVAKAQESEDFFADSIRRAKEILKKNTNEWRILDRWENESGYQWHMKYKSGVYADKELKNKILQLSKKLEEITNGGSTIDTTENEYSFSPEQKYEAYRLIISILKGAKKNVWIVDNYLDEIVFDFIERLNKDISLKIITDNQKPIFKRLYLALKEKSDRDIESRENNISHNRYIIIDDKIIYSIDASLNTIGVKDFMIHRITEKDEKILKKVNDWWVAGQEIV